MASRFSIVSSSLPSCGGADLGFVNGLFRVRYALTIHKNKFRRMSGHPEGSRASAPKGLKIAEEPRRVVPAGLLIYSPLLRAAGAERVVGDSQRRLRTRSEPLGRGNNEPPYSAATGLNRALPAIIPL